jgi:arginine/serine-rich splicing factor 16
MWHEARKQERKIRGIMVNYKKRAERRRAFYERMKTDPTTFLRIQGSNCKIHIEHQNSDNINMMPWQGDKSVMIDRFDARAHLDYIPEPLFTPSGKSTNVSEEKKLNYERYRTLVMIEASGATEEGYLKQLQQEEENPRTMVEEKRDKLPPKASIGYTYEDSNLVVNEADSDSESDTDLDIDVAINVDELDNEQREELDSLALKFGMESGKYCALLKADKDEAEHVQKVQDEEEARSQLRGRRAKRDRRSMKDRQRGTVSTSPLSYLRKASPSYEAYRESRSRSRSSSSGGEPTKVEYITEFGSQGNKDNNLIKSERKKGSSHDEIKSKYKRHDDSEQSRSTSEKYRKSRTTRRSRSTSHERHLKYRSRSRSRSPSYKRRSYRRSRSRSLSQENSETGDKRMKVMTQGKKKYDKTSGDKTKLTPQEKLKRRMQLALNKQLKMDKKEEKKKKEVKEQERQERDDDLREVSKRWNDRKGYRYSRSRSRSYSP